MLGFNEQKSRRIVDMRECHILRPELFALVEPLRSVLANLLKPRRMAEVQLTLVDQGADILLKDVPSPDLAGIELLTSFAAKHRLARLSIDQGIGPETIYEPVPATITLANVAVAFPVGGFVQATQDGEQALTAAVREALEGARSIADLFSGIGTFALSVNANYAAEASRSSVSALKRAAGDITVEHRDLYRRPLDVDELRTFDAVILDPPRAGAAEQVQSIALSSVGRIAYVSCNPATFARDARIIADGGYTLEWVKPVGQFRWSTHVELAALFVRQHK